MFRAFDRNLRVSKDRFDYYRCQDCGILFQPQPPADLARYYPPDYYRLPNSKDRLALLARREQFKLDLILPFRASGELLEIGPAWGSFAYAAKLAGFSVSVVESDERCRRYLDEVVGVHVHSPANVDALPPGLGTYDVIALWHVAEHLPHFEAFLVGLAARVRPGGVLAIATPNPEAWQFRVMGGHWPHVDAPRHLQLIPSRLLKDVLLPLGFEVGTETRTDAGGMSWNRFGWQRLLMNALPARGPFRMAALGAGYAIAKLVAPFDTIGAAYTLVLRRTAIPQV